MIIREKILKYILLILVFASLNIYAVVMKAIPEKFFELDLTDEEISYQGGGLEVLKSKGYCILVFNLYGEMGQEKFAFRLNQKGLINTRHVGYKCPVNFYEIKSDTEIILDFDKKYKASQNKLLFEKFNIYKKEYQIKY